MSNKSRGRAFEKKIQEYLESVGFKTDYARPTFRFLGPGRVISGPNDILGCIDIIGVHAEKPYTLFIQATASAPTSGNVAPRKHKMEMVAWNFAHHRVQVWTRYAPGMIRAYTLKKTPDHKQEWSESIFRLRPGVDAPVEVL